MSQGLFAGGLDEPGLEQCFGYKEVDGGETRDHMPYEKGCVVNDGVAQVPNGGRGLSDRVNSRDFGPVPCAKRQTDTRVKCEMNVEVSMTSPENISPLLNYSTSACMLGDTG